MDIGSGLNSLEILATRRSAADWVDNTEVAGAVTIDWSLGSHQTLTITTAACTVTQTGMVGSNENTLRVIDTNGCVITYSPAILWGAGSQPLLSAGANDIDYFGFVYDGTNINGFLIDWAMA